MSDASWQAKIGNVLHPVANVAQAIDFYQTVFGLGLKFADGDRYAALDAGGTSLALAGGEEDLTAGKSAVSFKVPIVADTIQAVCEAGGSIVKNPEHGPHEVRAVVLDPWSNLMIIYGPR